VSNYFNRLAKLRSEISKIKKSKKRKFNKEQQIMINFINGVTSSAEFKIKDITIILKRGDSKKGFQHILERHYCNGCRGELSATDIINIIDVYKRGIRLSEQGVSNKNLIVYKKIKGLDQLKLVLKPIGKNKYVVTLYRM